MLDKAQTPLDCIIIGGGPAGLTAAIYLARYRNNFKIFDINHSRALRIPKSHNYPGFVSGISGIALLKRLKKQLSIYSAPIINEQILSVQLETGIFIVKSHMQTYWAKNVLLSTGKADIEPILPNISRPVERGLIRHCPICDAYEVIGEKIGVIGDGETGLGEALFLRDYTEDLTLITLGKQCHWKKHELEKIHEANIRIIEMPIKNIYHENNTINIIFSDGEKIKFDCIYSALGCIKKNDIIENLPVNHKDGLLVVDNHQQTSINGLYAAGDMVSSLHQICVAQGQAAIAATAIHNRCRKLILK